MQDLKISLFKHTKDNHPRGLSLDWVDLCARLRDNKERPQKEGPLWSPVSYPPGVTRSNENVVAVHFLVLDYDQAIHPHDVRGRWEAFTYCLHSTHSHTEESPRWRAVFPLLSPVAGQSWDPVWKKLVYHLAPDTDEACKDPHRLYFLPAHPPGAPHFTLIHAGTRLDHTRFAELPPPPPRDSTGAIREVPPPQESLLVRAALDQASRFGRDNGGFWLACQLRDNRYTEGEALAIMGHYRSSVPPYNLKGEMEPYTDEHAIHNVRSAYSRPAREAWWRRDTARAEAGAKGGETVSEAPIQKARKATQKPKTEGLPASTASCALAAETLSESSPVAVVAESVEANGKSPKPHEPTERELGHKFGRELFGKYMTTDGGAWWRYMAGVWRQVDRHSVLAMVERLVADLIVKGQYVRLVENVTRIAGLRLYKPLAELNQHPTWICLQNGILDTLTGEMKEHCPTHLLTVQLPYDYHPGAECPRWMAFLAQVLVDREGQTSPELIRLVQEWFGYCLIPDARAQTSMWWLGGGANGKGVATKILEQLVGRGQRCGVDIEQLHDPYQRSSLHGMLLGIIGEIPLRAMIKNGERFKEIVSADPVSARSPGKDFFTYTPTIRILCTANELPKTADKTFGYFRRLKIIRWRRNFEVAEQNTNLLQELSEELPGIFGWALDGLYRLQEQGYQFSHTPDADNELAEYRHDQDAAARFVDDWCRRDEGETESFAELWQAYRRWCKLNGEGEESSNSFSRSLTRLGFADFYAWDAVTKKSEKRRKGLQLVMKGYETTYGTV